MIDEMLVHVGLRRSRVALLSGARLVELREARAGDGPAPGDIHLVRVGKAAPALDGVFVTLAGGVDGAIAGRHGGRGLQEGAAVLAQVDRAAQDGKGPRLTTRLRLPGRLAVLQPAGGAPAVAARLADGAARARLLAAAKRLSAAGDGDLLLRSRAVDALPDELAHEAEALRRRWAGLEAEAARLRAPALVLQDDVAAAALRDHLSSALRRIAVDDGATARRLRALCAGLLPGSEAAVEALPPGADALAAEAVQRQLASALAPQVALPGGGWLRIEAAAALTAVDVNAGTAGGGDPQALWREVNLAAAAELGRQLRLRDIGGVVVVDFIRMADPGAAGRVLAALRAACADDPADVRIAGFSEFGLVELTRRRRGAGPAHRFAACPACEGSGRRRDLQALVDDLLDEIERQARRNGGRPLQAAAAPELVAAVDEAGIAAALAQRTGCRVGFRAEPERPRDSFAVWAA